ncbi:hypothetical protein HYY72_02255 [Candidatus Woesearchaeota archaeon]|nr:hypothetical protein [Candidatus Woesearchaeota archaeon]
MKLKSWHLFAALSIIFFSIQATHFRYAISDENIYFYMAKLIAHGQMPYADFFLAHPPMHILMLSLFYIAFGFNIILLKATAPLAIIGAAWFTFKLAREKLGSTEAIIAAMLFYFSYDVMRFSTFAVWITLATMLTAASAYYALTNRHLAGGMAMAAASMTGLLSIIAGIAISGYLLITDRKGFLKYAAAFLGLLIVLNMLLILLFGSAYMNDTYYYHLEKPAEGTNKEGIITLLLKSNPLLFGTAALFAISRRKSRHIFLASIAIISSYALVLGLLMSSIFSYYFMLAMPFLAIIGARGAAGIVELTREHRRTAVLAAIIIIITLLSAKSSYDYEVNTFQDYAEAQEVAGYISGHSSKSDLIFGDDSVTPLIALLSEREIALNIVDSNNLRWRAGQLNASETIKSLKEKKVKFIIERRVNDGKGSYIYGPSYLDEFKNFIKTSCKPVKVFKRPWEKYQMETYIFDCAA